jgi:hypothetical protein
MKHILLITLFFAFSGFKQDVKLDGTYKAEFENYFQNDGYVNFYGNNFKWRPKRFLPFEGKINYTKNRIYLESESNLIYSIAYENVKNDTIIFYVYDKNGKGNYLDIAIGKGKLIKAK